MNSTTKSCEENSPNEESPTDPVVKCPRNPVTIEEFFLKLSGQSMMPTEADSCCCSRPQNRSLQTATYGDHVDASYKNFMQQCGMSQQPQNNNGCGCEPPQSPILMQQDDDFPAKRLQEGNFTDREFADYIRELNDNSRAYEIGDIAEPKFNFSDQDFRDYIREQQTNLMDHNQCEPVGGLPKNFSDREFADYIREQQGKPIYYQETQGPKFIFTDRAFAAYIREQQSTPIMQGFEAGEEPQPPLTDKAFTAYIREQSMSNRDLGREPGVTQQTDFTDTQFISYLNGKKIKALLDGDQNMEQCNNMNHTPISSFSCCCCTPPKNDSCSDCGDARPTLMTYEYKC